MILTSYLTENYKQYRILPSYDLRTNQFPRKLNGNIEDADIYIKCTKGIKVFYYGRSLLDIYFPSKKTGLSVIRSVYSEHINPKNVKIETKEVTRVLKGKERIATQTNIKILNNKLFEEEIKNNIFLYIEESDSELLIRIKAKDFEKFVPYIKPSEYGSNIKPFSVKNLPKSNYVIPDDDLILYTKLVTKENKLLLGNITTNFIKSLATKKRTYDEIKADMLQKGLKGKNYIHCIGEWDKYITYLSEHLNE